MKLSAVTCKAILDNNIRTFVLNQDKYALPNMDLVQFNRKQEDCILYFINGHSVSELTFKLISKSEEYIRIVSYRKLHNRRELVVEDI